MSYMRDSFGRRLDAMVARRDLLPEPLFHFKCDEITGANGAAIGYLTDSGPMGQDLWQDTPANRPVLVTGGLNGRNYLNCQGGQSLMRPTTLVNNTLFPAALNPPFSIFAVARAKSGTYTTDRVIAGYASFNWSLGVTGASGFGASLQLNGPARVSGDDVGDDTWHVFAGVADTNSAAVWIDGACCAASVTTFSVRSSPQASLGGNYLDTTTPFNGDIAEILCLAGRLNHDRVADVTAALAAKWGLS